MTQAVVVAAFIVNDNKVLLARRSDNKNAAPGRFHFPGGHVEFGEQPEEALRRELLEELGVSATVGSPFASFSYMNEFGVHTIAIIYEATAEERAVHLNNGENTALVWVSASEIPSYLSVDDPLFLVAQAGFERTN